MAYHDEVSVNWIRHCLFQLDERTRSSVPELKEYLGLVRGNILVRLAQDVPAHDFDCAGTMEDTLAIDVVVASSGEDPC